MVILSLVWGILSLVGLFVGFLPCFGALNWLNIPFSVVGLIISIVAMNGAPQQERGKTIVGVVCCAIAIVIGFIRLVAGGGVV